MVRRLVSRLVPAVSLALAFSLALATPTDAQAFCGFYVGKAGAQLFNEASQVVLTRDGERTVVTMSNDYRGELKEFALVVPVPAVLSKEQIHVGDRKYIERLDAYSSPRLVEYFDPDPCEVDRYRRMEKAAAAPSAAVRQEAKLSDGALGVKVEAEYTVGEYDIVILSATESTGLETWLIRSGYKIPPRAAQALAPYIKQDMKFFVAKVNLKEMKKRGGQYLRPLQMAYESKKFMLPIRLGMANANGPQDLVVYLLTRKGRVETTNYRTVKVPSDMDVPLFVKEDFGKVYKAIYERAHEKESKRAVLTEYVWDMGWCDPCAANPLTADELLNLGVFWLDDAGDPGSPPPMARRRIAMSGGASPVLLTRLHVRYDSEHFPEDLVFQETGDRTNFQARYVLRHPFKGGSSCSQMEGYRAQVKERRRKEAETLADITGWSETTIRERMGEDAPAPADPWYRKLWK